MVVLDTNALFLAVRHGFPLEQEIGRLVPGARLMAPESVLAELEGLARSLTPGAMAALALCQRYETTPTTERGDDGLLEAAQRHHATVVTADRELRRRLAIRGVPVLIPRDRHRLELVPGRPPARPRPTGGSPPSPASGYG